MHIPIYSKLKYSTEVLIERRLPEQGMLVVKEGDPVLPFTKIGKSKVSREFITLDPKIRLTKKAAAGDLLYKGEQMGKIGLLKSFVAPYNGYVEHNNNKLVFSQEKRDIWILSGAWGTVERIEPAMSVFIKTQTVDLDFVMHTSQNVMGELVVFPNPSELLDMEYLEKFPSSGLNKVIYVGHHIRKPVVEKAIELRMGAVFGGSIDKNAYNLARLQKLPLAIMTGFGHLETPMYVFEFLKTISNRHVLFDGVAGKLQIPMPPENAFKKDPVTNTLREVKIGLKVILMEKYHFGDTGFIEDVQSETIYVKLDKSGETVQVRIPNIFALA